MFGLIRKLRRRRLAKRPFPRAWFAHLEAQVPFFSEFDEPLRERFLTQLKIFCWEKVFIGAGGLEISDEMRVVIGAAAVRLTLHLGLSRYDQLTEIIVYPTAYVHPDEADAVILGEAHDWGVVVLAWDAVLGGLANTEDGLDTATHEFAHVLDREGGAFNGTPRLARLGLYRQWAAVMSKDFLSLRRGERRLRRLLGSYGAQDEAEFFAVASEAFFEKASQMKEAAPALYALLSDFYGCNPAREHAADAQPGGQGPTDAPVGRGGSRRRSK